MGIFKNLFGSSGPSNPPFAALGMDVHSHLIPGIDDGSVDMEDSLQLIRALMDLGYNRFITTPHIMSDAYRNTPEIIQNGLADLKEALDKEGLAVEIEAAAEYYLDEWFIQNLEKTDLLSFGGAKRYLLFETSYVARPMALKETIFRLKTMGFTPIMAHPERYQYFWKYEDVEAIRVLRSRGALMQVNLTSFAGTRGRRAARIARDMAKEGLIDFIGSDLHRMSQIPAIRRAWDISKELRQLVASGSLLNTTL